MRRSCAGVSTEADALVSQALALGDRQRVGNLARLIPRPRALRTNPGRAPKRIAVLTKGSNPSFAYYLEARLSAGTLPFSVHSIDDGGLGGLDPTDTLIIVCRYIRFRHLRWLRRHREALAGVALFIDDDIAALIADGDTPAAYSAYLARFGAAPLPWLNRELTGVWASTRALAEALRDPDGRIPAVLGPAPDMEENRPASQSRAGPSTIAFHATGAHEAEHRFLIPVLSEVLAARPEAHFEVVAKGRSKRLWTQANLPQNRITVRAPQPWPAYRRETQARGADILLIPLMDTPSNAVRADTKRIDCMRMNAAGVFSLGPVYEPRRQPCEVFVANEPKTWSEAIIGLIDDRERRRMAVDATRHAVETMIDGSDFGLPGPDHSGRGGRNA